MRVSILRLSATHLRIIVLAGNLLLGAGVLGYAGYSYYGVSQMTETTELAPHSRFDYRPGEANVGNPNSPGRLSIVASWLDPQKKAAIDASASSEDGKEKEKEGSGTLSADATVKEPGPLAENWEYVAYILREDPLQNWVKLRKKEGAALPNIPGRPSTQMTVRRPVTTARTRTVGGIKGPLQASNSVSFFVADRTYTIQDSTPGAQPTTFYIHAANEKELVYWMPGEPKKLYYLPFQAKSTYLADADPKRGLKPPPKPAEDGAQEEAKPPPQFIRVPNDMEDAREREYDALRRGESAGPVITQMQESAKPPEAAAGGTGLGGTQPVTGGLNAPPGGPAAGGPKPMTAAEKQEGMRKIREIMKSDKVKPEDREALEKALRGPAK